uniref:Uncharacterized protein n=1 Tax=Panthera leo TaxID=9689 RepID=A0A8C8WHZ2_PANLE
IMSNVECLFMCLLAIYMYSLQKCLFMSSAIFNWIIWFFSVELHKFFTYFGYYFFIQYGICKYLLLESHFRPVDSFRLNQTLSESPHKVLVFIV